MYRCLLSLLGLLQYRCVPGNRYRSTGPSKFPGLLSSHCVPGNRYMFTGPSEFPGVTIISLCSRKQMHVYRALWVSWGYYHLTMFQETDTCIQCLLSLLGLLQYRCVPGNRYRSTGPSKFPGLLSSHCVPGNRYMFTGPSEFPGVTIISLCPRKQIHVYRTLWVSSGYYRLSVFQETDTCLQGPLSFLGLLSSHYVPGNRYMSTGPSEFPGVTTTPLCSRKQIHVYRALWVSWGYYHLTVFQETDTCLQDPLSFLGLLSSHCVPGNRYMFTGPSEFPRVTIISVCSRKQIHIYRALWVSWGDYNTTVFQETDTCLQGPLSFLGLLSSHCVPGNRYISTGPSEFPGVTTTPLCSRKQIHVYRALWVSWGYYHLTVFQETDTCLQGPLSFLGLLSSHCAPGNRYMSTGPSEFPGVTIISLCSRKQIHVYRALWVSWGYYHLTVLQETDTCLQGPLSFLGLLSSHCAPGNRYMSTGPSEFPGVTIISLCSRKQIHIYRALWVSWGDYNTTVLKETKSGIGSSSPPPPPSPLTFDIELVLP